jgi:hypothetical protein
MSSGQTELVQYSYNIGAEPQLNPSQAKLFAQKLFKKLYAIEAKREFFLEIKRPCH